MAKKCLVYKSIRNGVQGPRLRLHIMIGNNEDVKLVFSPRETRMIYKMIGDNLDSDLEDVERIGMN